MPPVPFSILDVFAQRRFEGNQLAVVRHASQLSPDQMQLVARETNFSETTFLPTDEPGADGAFECRIFTPREEIPFAGHPTLGTAFVLMEDVLGGAREATLRLKVGAIRVWRADDGVLWMRQNAPTFGARHDRRTMAAILGLREGDVRADLPVEDVSTGLPHAIVPLASLDAVKRVRVDANLYDKWCAQSPTKSIMVYAPGASDPANQLTARVFPIYYGIAEDPATGSANGCLAAYLSRHEALGSARVDARVEQGAQVGRPSLLHLRAEGARVEVGGRVVRVADGVLHA